MATQPLTAEELAELFHDLYERLAPAFGYETRRQTAVPWSAVPAQNKQLMIAVSQEILQRLFPAEGAERTPVIPADD